MDTIYDVFEIILDSPWQRHRTNEMAGTLANKILDYMCSDGSRLITLADLSKGPISRKEHPESDFIGLAPGMSQDEMLSLMLQVVERVDLESVKLDDQDPLGHDFYGASNTSQEAANLQDRIDKILRVWIDDPGDAPTHIQKMLYHDEHGKSVLIDSFAFTTWGTPLLPEGDAEVKTFPYRPNLANRKHPRHSQGPHIDGNGVDHGTPIAIVHSGTFTITEKGVVVVANKETTRVYINFNYNARNCKNPKTAIDNWTYFVPTSGAPYFMTGGSFPHAVGSIEPNHFRFSIVHMYRAANPPGYGLHYSDMTWLNETRLAYDLQTARDLNLRAAAPQLSFGPWCFDSEPVGRNAMSNFGNRGTQTIFKVDPYSADLKLSCRRSATENKLIKHLFNPFGKAPSTSLWVEFAESSNEFIEMLQLKNMSSATLERLNAGNAVHTVYSIDAHLLLATAPARRTAAPRPTVGSLGTKDEDVALRECFDSPLARVAREDCGKVFYDTATYVLGAPRNGFGSSIIGRINSATIWPLEGVQSTVATRLRAEAPTLGPFLSLGAKYVIIMDVALFEPAIPFACDVPSNGAIDWTAHTPTVRAQQERAFRASRAALWHVEPKPKTTWAQTTVPPSAAPRKPRPRKPPANRKRQRRSANPKKGRTGGR